MNFYIQQTITIHSLKVNSISNSSVLQIGSAGMITPISNTYNPVGDKDAEPVAETEAPISGPVVPLTPPTA